MGIKLFSSSSYDEPVCKKVTSPNPDPTDYRIMITEEVGRFLILYVQYPGCTNFEGTKILVYENVNLEKLKKQKSLDPHFSSSLCYYSPIARFIPTPKGLLYARKFCELAL